MWVLDMHSLPMISKISTNLCRVMLLDDEFSKTHMPLVIWLLLVPTELEFWRKECRREQRKDSSKHSKISKLDADERVERLSRYAELRNLA